MATFTTHELYGGAITCRLPSDYIDSSTLREIPSHQEVYLSPTTLTNIIIEINQYESPPGSNSDAAIYHFKDVIDAADTLQSSTQPAAVSMQSPSLAVFPAVGMSGTVVSTEKASSNFTYNSNLLLPAEWEQTPQTVNVHTMMYQLLVRMKSVETDLCVRINVPLKEFEGEAGKKETGFAEECLRRMVESLDVKDFGLFEG